VDILLGLAILAVALAIAVVVFLAREGRISSRVLQVMAGLCSVGLLAMLLTDWPSEVLAEFWADHSVVAGVLSTVLLVGIGFLVFEVRDVRQQEDLDRSLTAAGLGGLVDHVVDVEVAMALAFHDVPPDVNGWDKWDRQQRPLRWLREGRHRLERADGEIGPEDPRRWGPPGDLTLRGDTLWRRELIDQAVRRILAAIRDWAPVTGRSRNGVQALISLAEIRNDLMRLDRAVGQGDRAGAATLVLSIRRRCRVLAHMFECASGVSEPRAEVLTTMHPLGGAEPRQTSWRDLLRNDWEVQLERSETILCEAR
jgi:hypothetical protein